jgi:hypothetical protein
VIYCFKCGELVSMREASPMKCVEVPLALIVESIVLSLRGCVNAGSVVAFVT